MRIKLFENFEGKWYEEITESEWPEYKEIDIKQKYLDKLIQLGHELPGSFRPFYNYRMVAGKYNTTINHIEFGMTVPFSRGSNKVFIYHCEDHYFLVAILWGFGSGFTRDADYWKCDDWEGVEIFFKDLINGKIYEN